jgi:hypothetical protein
MKPVLFIVFLALVPALADHTPAAPPQCAAPTAAIDSGAVHATPASVPVAFARVLSCEVPS